MKRLSTISVSLFIAGLLTNGCAVDPTFKKDTLATDVQQLLSEQGLATETKLLEHTLAIHVDAENSLLKVGEQVGIGPEFENVNREVLSVLHRVIMSSDAEIRFYIVLISDPLIPGAYLTVLRNMDDVKRFNVSMLDTNEFISRTVFELNYVGPDIPIDLDQYVQRDIRIEEFLSWQLAKRIQSELTEHFASKEVTVGRCAGGFFNNEFIFTLNVEPVDQAEMDDETISDTFDTAKELIKKVLESYDFKDFSGIRLVHHPTGRDLILPKHALNNLIY